MNAPGDVDSLTADMLRCQFDFNHGSIRLNCTGLTHDESMITPQPAGSCANWVLGHIVAFRSSVLKLLGEPPYWTSEECSPYGRGSERLDPSAARPFESLLVDLDATQQKIRAGIARLAPGQLAAIPEGEKRSLAHRLFFLQFHEAYHAGQLGVLRRIAGKDGAI